MMQELDNMKKKCGFTIIFFMLTIVSCQNNGDIDNKVMREIQESKEKILFIRSGNSLLGQKMLGTGSLELFLKDFNRKATILDFINEKMAATFSPNGKNVFYFDQNKSSFIKHSIATDEDELTKFNYLNYSNEYMSTGFDIISLNELLFFSDTGLYKIFLERGTVDTLFYNVGRLIYSISISRDNKYVAILSSENKTPNGKPTLGKLDLNTLVLEWINLDEPVFVIYDWDYSNQNVIVKMTNGIYLFNMRDKIKYKLNIELDNEGVINNLKCIGKSSYIISVGHGENVNFYIFDEISGRLEKIITDEGHLVLLDTYFIE